MQDALLYINDPKKTVLQIKLRQMIVNAESVNGDAGRHYRNTSGSTDDPGRRADFQLDSGADHLSVLQKYFVKGVMIGAVKG